jgi:hypothetical protein
MCYQPKAIKEKMMAELTAEMIVDQTFPNDVQLSPDGKQVAYTLALRSKKEEHETSAIWIASTDRAGPCFSFFSVCSNPF